MSALFLRQGKFSKEKADPHQAAQRRSLLQARLNQCIQVITSLLTQETMLLDQKMETIKILTPSLEMGSCRGRWGCGREEEGRQSGCYAVHKNPFPCVPSLYPFSALMTYQTSLSLVAGNQLVSLLSMENSSQPLNISRQHHYLIFQM